MRLFQQLKTIPLYIDYFLKVVDKHSLQAPYIFNFYNQLLEEIKKTNAIDKIEKFRRSLLKNHTVIYGKDYGAGSRISPLPRNKLVSSIAKYGISSRKDCIFLLALASIIQPKKSIELGTSLGIATAYLANVNSLNNLYSFEGNDMLITKAKDILEENDYKNVKLIQGNIDEELPRLLESINQIDFVFIDANHTKKALLNYYSMLQARIAENGVIMVDDIRWSVEMYRGWSELVKRTEVTLSVEFLNKGLLFFKRGIRKQHYTLSI